MLLVNSHKLKMVMALTRQRI